MKNGKRRWEAGDSQKQGREWLIVGEQMSCEPNYELEMSEISHRMRRCC
jgi:hypothetical protein